MKQKHGAYLPDNTLVLIFTFCGASDLFFTIPFLSKHILQTLKKPTLTEEQITKLLPVKRASNNEKRENFAQFVRNLTAVEENKIWKQLLLKIEPAFGVIQVDNLFCFKKHYVQNYVLEKPMHQHKQNLMCIIQLLSELSTDELSAAILIDLTQKNDKDLELHKLSLATQVGSLAGSLESISKQLREEQSALLGRDHASPSNDHKKKQNFKTPPKYHHEFQNVIRILRETAVIKQESTNPDPMLITTEPCTWKHTYHNILFSPTNAKTAKVYAEVAVVGKSEGGRRITTDSKSAMLTVFLHDVIGEEVRTIPFSGYQLTSFTVSVEPKQLWKVACHLGLDVLCPTIIDRIQLLHSIWFDVIAAAAKVDTDTFHEALDLMTYSGPEMEVVPKTAFEMFKYLGVLKLQAQGKELNSEADIKEAWEMLSERERLFYAQELSDLKADCAALFTE